MPPFEVSPAAAHELLSACRVLFADGAEPRAARLRADADTSGVFVARAGGKLCAAALVQVVPGALGVAWPPRGAPAEAVDAVTAAACAWLRARGAKVCQAFAAASARDAMAPLERAGFRHTTQLVFLRRALVFETIPPKPDQPFAYWPERPPHSDEFRRVLLATHEGSLDCPELNANRTSDELLAAFGEAPSLGGWNLVRENGELVGVTIAATDSESNTAEVTYIGILPAFRGRGIGSRLLKQDLWAFYHASVRELTLSVDARNAPAMKMYARHGFVEYDRREVWLASWLS